MTAHDQCFRILPIRYYVKITVWVIWIYSSKIRRNTIYNIISSFVGFSYKLINTSITIEAVTWSKTNSKSIRFTFGSFSIKLIHIVWNAEPLKSEVIFYIPFRGGVCLSIPITSKIQRFTVYIIYLRSPMITIFEVYLFSTPFTWTVLVVVCTYQKSIAITLTIINHSISERQCFPVTSDQIFLMRSSFWNPMPEKFQSITFNILQLNILWYHYQLQTLFYRIW